MGTSRLERLIQLLGLIQSGYGASVEYLADTLNCSPRTVFRDIKLLNESGLAVHYSAELGRYTVSDQLMRLTSTLDEAEFVKLLVAATVSPLHRFPGIGGIVNEAITKLLNSASASVRIRVNNAVRALAVDEPWPTEIPDDALEKMCTILECVERRQCARVHWRDAANHSWFSTKLAVYQIATVHDGLNVIGRSTYHRQLIKMRLRSIVRLEVLLEDTYDVPAEFLQGGLTGTVKTRQKLAERVASLPLIG